MFTQRNRSSSYSVHYYRNRALSREYISDLERERIESGESRVCVYLLLTLSLLHITPSSTLASCQLQHCSFINTYSSKAVYLLNKLVHALCTVKLECCLYALCCCILMLPLNNLINLGNSLLAREYQYKYYRKLTHKISNHKIFHLFLHQTSSNFRAISQ